MAIVELVYGDITTAQYNAKSTQLALDDYSSTITNKVIAKLNSLSGADSNGYIGSALSSAASKKSELTGKVSSFTDLETQLKDLRDEAELVDAKVSNRISSLAEQYNTEISVKSVCRAFGNWFYNLFCVDIPNWIAQKGEVGEAIVNWIRSKARDTSHFIDQIWDHFKYGGGQYAMNKIKAVNGVVIAAAAFVGAIATIVGAVALAVAVTPAMIVAAVAGGIVLICAIFNASRTIKDNNKAEELYNSGNKGLAHYYGGTDGLHSYIKHHDLGSEHDNLMGEIGGTVFDVVDYGARIAFAVASADVAYDKYTGVYGYDSSGKLKVVGHDTSLSHIRDNAQAWSQLDKYALEDGGSFWKDLGSGLKRGKNWITTSGLLDGIDAKDFDGLKIGDFKIGKTAEKMVTITSTTAVWLTGQGDVSNHDMSTKAPQFVFDIASILSDAETKSGIWEDFFYKWTFEPLEKYYDVLKDVKIKES